MRQWQQRKDFKIELLEFPSYFQFKVTDWASVCYSLYCVCVCLRLCACTLTQLSVSEWSEDSDSETVIGLSHMNSDFILLVPVVVFLI